MISIIIATKNRPRPLRQCLTYISAYKKNDLEIIVIDQSRGYQTRRMLKKLHDKRIIYLYHVRGGKSEALNLGIVHAKGNILAFTDDDCIVSSHWISEIHRIFKKYPTVDALFGRTLPYEPQHHAGQRCPSVFTVSRARIIRTPTYHATTIGFGNNMALRASVFATLGNFKKWLGPGSIGSNAEDAELAVRLLISGKRIRYTPSIVVFHNKWLSPKQMFSQNLSYYCGEMACYGYYHFQNYGFASAIVTNNMRASLYALKQDFIALSRLKWDRALFHNLARTTREFLRKVYGLMVGLVFAYMDPLQDTAS